MSSIHTISKEYLYKLKLSFRQIIPSSEIFYIFFFMVKFFDVILFTHSIYPNSPKQNLFTISKIIKALVILKNSPEISYIPLCIFLYIIITIFLICFIIIILKYIGHSNETDLKLYDIPTNSLHLSPSVKILFKFTSIFYVIIAFFYQHLIEILFFGIFKVYFDDTTNIQNSNNARILLSYNHKYIICGINCFYILILVSLMYLFFLISSTETLTHSYGYQLSSSHSEIILRLILCSLQGVYSTSFFYEENYKINFHIVWCYIMIGILFADFLINLKQINYLSSSLVAKFVRFISNFCLISGIIEICIYNCISGNQKNDQKYYLLKFLLDSMNAFILTWFVSYLQKKHMMYKLANSLFLINKSCHIKSLFEFYLQLQSIKIPQEKYLYILNLIQEHQQKCALEICLCHKYKKYFIMMSSEMNINKIINKFISLGEKKIVDSIMRDSNLKSNSKMSQLLYIHCDFLYSIKQNDPVTIYLSQYYLIRRKNDLKFKYAYLLYEINALSYRKKINQNYNKGIVSFLKENLIFEKIKKVIFILSTDIEKLLYYKSLKNSNSKLLYTCEDILQPLIEFIKQNKKLSYILTRYVVRNIFDHSIEIKYLVYNYIKLFHIELPHKIRKKFYTGREEYPSYFDLCSMNTDQNNLKNNKMILFLNSDNKFIIRYISTEVVEFLLFHRNELIGADFNDILIPKEISLIHSIYMKEFVLSGYSNYSKNIFLLNKEMKITPVYIKCKVLPTKSTLYSIILNIEPSKVASYSQYMVMCDSSFNFLCISESFESQFYFSLKILNSLKINFCDLFSLNRDRILDYFKRMTKDNTKNQKQKKYQPLASTSIKNEEIYYYQSIPLNIFAKIVKSNIKGSQEEEEITLGNGLTKSEVVGKDKIVNSIIKFGKNMEELGLEKEWKWKLNDLFTKFKCKGIFQGEFKNQLKKKDSTKYKSKLNFNTKTSNTNELKANPNPEDNFYIKFILKKIGNIQFYIVVISELMEEHDSIIESNSDVTQSKGESNKMKLLKQSNNNVNVSTSHNNNSYSFLNPNTSASSLLPLDNTKTNFSSINTSQVTETSKFANASSVDLISNDSLTATTENFMDDKKKKKINKTELKSNTSLTDTITLLEKQNKKLKILKFGQLILLLIVFILNLVNFFINSLAIKYSLKLFYVNAYSFLLENDIYFGALSSFELCLVTDKIQVEPYVNEDERKENFLNKIKMLSTLLSESANNLMVHYHKLNFNINKMIDKPEMRKVYAILNEADLYRRMSSNWTTSNENSSLREEILSFHYYLKTFKISDYETEEIFLRINKHNNCRLSKFYFNMNYLNYANQTKLKEDDMATTEEKFIFYILSNVMTKYGTKLEELTKTTNGILYADNNTAKIESIVFNIAILLSVILLYSFIIVSIHTSREIFKNRMVFLFSPHQNEAVFYEDIKKFKNVTENFTITHCDEYTSYKNQLKKYYSEPSKSAFLFFGKQINTMRIMNTGTTKNSRKRESICEGKDPKNVFTPKPKGEEETHDKDENTQKQFESLAEPKYVFCSIIILCLTFLIFAIFEIVNIVISTQLTNGLKVENEFAINFLQRVPKLNQLVLYTVISAIGGSSKLFTRKHEEYEENVLSNYYDVSLNIEQNSLFQKIGESLYGYLYYQLHVIRTNILYFINDIKMHKYLPQTTKNEFLFHNGENFCIYTNIVFFSQGDTIYSAKDIFSLSSEKVKTCRKLGNGMNLSGYKAGIDLTVQQLSNLYLSFTERERKIKRRTYEIENKVEENQIEFLNNEDVILIEDNVLQTYQTLHQADTYLLRNDIVNSYNNSRYIRMIFSIVSICLGCGVVFAILIIIINRLESYNDVINEIVRMFESSIKKYSFKN